MPLDALASAFLLTYGIITASLCAIAFTAFLVSPRVRKAYRGSPARVLFWTVWGVSPLLGNCQARLRTQLERRAP